MSERGRATALGLVVLTAAGCGSSRTDRQPDEWSRVTWPTMVALVGSCRAVKVGQTHNRVVTAKTRDRRRVWTREPRIDVVIPVVNRANARCGPITFATE